MAHELIDVSNERSWAAVDRTLSLHATQGETPLGLLAWVAVDEIFCTGVTGIKDAFEHRLSVIHAVLVADVLQRAEAPWRAVAGRSYSISHPPLPGWKYSSCDCCVCSAGLGSSVSTRSQRAHGGDDLMPKMTFVLRDGTCHEVDAPLGLSVLEVAHKHGVDLEGACEGSLACATCHVIVDPAWIDRRGSKPGHT